MQYTANPDRYQDMIYNRCGQSGLLLPAISLGMWHNFGDDTAHQTKVDICTTAFDLELPISISQTIMVRLLEVPKRPSDKY